MREKIKGDRYICDAPGCTVTTIAIDGDIADVYGFHGTAMQVSQFGGTANVDWFACTPDHIRHAVEEAITRSRAL